jgi:predicted transporter
MRSKIQYWISFIWASVIAFSFPICLGGIYQDITGHAKGFGYDLGSEKDISIAVGCIELLIWLVLALPSNIYVFKRTKEKGICYVIITAILFMMLFFLGIYFVGGWNEFEKFFHA